MNDKLYIIGNGFDLHHGIKTNYVDFRNYLEENFPDLFDSLESYYNMDEDSLLWSEFENGLKEFDPTDLENNFGEYLPDYSSDGFRDRDRYDYSIISKMSFNQSKMNYKRLLISGLLQEKLL